MIGLFANQLVANKLEVTETDKARTIFKAYTKAFIVRVIKSPLP